MKHQVNIIAVVDVIGALSGSTLLDGNLCMMDDGGHNSAHQGTPNLCTVVKPGQVVSWSALAVDLQTPVEIKNISFVPADQNGHTSGQTSGQAQSQTQGQGQGQTQGQMPGQPYGQPQGQPYGQSHGQSQSHAQGAQGGNHAEGDKLDLDVWTGVVPNWLTPGVAYQYRLELQMYEGENSVMHIDTPALMCE
ncbi:hypothetical protein GCM10009837_18440 [Streptomyces durmitorensis]|uniref:Uncharacterized protein n=1 Tax=Streptomyces durmitorensis TaxID=319947 RepID=A0ABY4PNU4_9ACTN|nr:hypothetical protein [Streptomyces durmitorensis]UQT55470.1 hypothetical protein M4V62_10425 [Streptomyces durmitorensis]